MQDLQRTITLIFSDWYFSNPSPTRPECIQTLLANLNNGLDTAQKEEFQYKLMKQKISSQPQWTAYHSNASQAPEI